MENASKALIMAAEILIGIILISTGIYIFKQASEVPTNYSRQLEVEKLQAFNSEFEAYKGEKNISAQDIVTVINMAIENNRKYDITEQGYYINVYLNGVVVNNYTEEQKITMMNNTSKLDDFYSYKCTEIGYDEVTGRVISIKFIKK